MREKIFLTICLLIVLFIVAHTFILSSVSIPVAQREVPVTLTITPTPQTMLDAKKLSILINDYRVSRGLKPLRESQVLCDIANKRIKETGDIAISHDGFLKYTKNNTFLYMGENLVIDMGNEDESLKAWLKSPEHFENIVNTLYTDECLKTKGDMAVQMFGTIR